MRNARTIWKHEVDQADKIVRLLIERSKEQPGWKKFFLPMLLTDYIRFRRKHKLTRKNLLFTRELAFEVAREVFQGKPRAEEMRFIEIKTKKLLEQDRSGLYTEKVRRKQMNEMELLVDHYLVLFSTDRAQYAEMVRAAYEFRSKYQSFLAKLQQAEEGVIQATLATMRKGSKKERIHWFNRVKEATREIKIKEVEKIFPEG